MNNIDIEPLILTARIVATVMTVGFITLFLLKWATELLDFIHKLKAKMREEKKKKRKFYCHSCGYPRIGLPVIAICPECGSEP